jgi:hypothetical protein
LSISARSGRLSFIRLRFSMNAAITRPARRGEPPAVWGLTMA